MNLALSRKFMMLSQNFMNLIYDFPEHLLPEQMHLIMEYKCKLSAYDKLLRTEEPESFLSEYLSFTERAYSNWRKRLEGLASKEASK